MFDAMEIIHGIYLEILRIMFTEHMEGDLSKALDREGLTVEEYQKHLSKLVYVMFEWLRTAGGDNDEFMFQ